jgi:dUTP pyrophosphatase
MLKERGSTGTKGLAQRCGIVDSGYRGEWFCPINNTSNKTIIITKDIEKTKQTIFAKEYSYAVVDSIEELDKLYTFYPYSKAITQALLLPVPKVEIKEISAEDLKSIPSLRGETCLGGSGK